MHELGKHH